MLGAFAGDIIGSVYERYNIKKAQRLIKEKYLIDYTL